MKWFKHDSNASADAKLKRVRMKYGMQGYGLYWYCLELIAANVDKHNLTFELEHDSEIIAHDTGINYELVQEMMTYMVKLGLFEEVSGTITCMKMLKRIDQSMTSDREMRNLVAAAKQNHDEVMSESCHNRDLVMKEQNRTEQNRTEQNRDMGKRKRFTPPTTEDVAARCREMGYTVNPDRFIAHYSANGWKVGRNPMKCWKSALAGWQAREGPDTNTRRTSLRDDLTDTSWAH